MFSSRPNYNKLKVNLKLAINRLKLLEKKKTELALKARKEIADYLAAGKEDRARIRVEHIVREDYMVEGLELLELYCDLLVARFGLIEHKKFLDEGLREAISSIIWASLRIQADIQEFKTLSDILSSKYGKEFAEVCRVNGEGSVNPRLMQKFATDPPPAALIERYLVEIAKSFNVHFEPNQEILNEAERKQNIDNEEVLIDFESSGSNKNDFNRGGGYGGGGGGHFVDPLPMPVPPMAPPSAPHHHPGGASAAPYPHAAPLQPPYRPIDTNPQNPYPPFSNTPTEHKVPPPLPGIPPNAHHQSLPPGPASYNSTDSGSSMPSGQPPQPPAYNGIGNDKEQQPPPYTSMPYNPAGNMGPPQQPGAMGPPPPQPGVKGLDTLPELPSVPGTNPNSFPPLDQSAGGEDVDFDDLTRRFEQLKKKK